MANAKVEVAVQVAQRWILARLRNRRFFSLAELNAAGASDSDINKITWENSCRFFGWDPFELTPKEQATVGALRVKGADVDVSIRPRAEWARLYDEKQFART